MSSVLDHVIQRFRSNEPWATYAIEEKQAQIAQLEYEIEQIRRVQRGEITRFGRVKGVKEAVDQ